MIASQTVVPVNYVQPARRVNQNTNRNSSHITHVYDAYTRLFNIWTLRFFFFVLFLLMLFLAVCPLNILWNCFWLKKKKNNTFSHGKVFPHLFFFFFLGCQCNYKRQADGRTSSLEWWISYCLVLHVSSLCNIIDTLLKRVNISCMALFSLIRV